MFIFPGLLDFCGAAPFTYDHATGGGAYNDRSIGRWKDVVESLEGGDFKCGDYASYFVAAKNWPYSDPKLTVTHNFGADSTGQSGVAFIDLRASVNCNQKMVENGDNSTGNSGGKGVYGIDGGCKTKNTLKITFSVDKSQTPYTKKALIPITWTLDGISAGDSFVVRIDALIGCNGQRATGNLLAKTMSAALGNGNGVNVGEYFGLDECYITLSA